LLRFCFVTVLFCFVLFHVLKPLIASLLLPFSILKLLLILYYSFMSIKYNVMHGFTSFRVPQKLKLRHIKLFVMATASLNLPMTVGAQHNDVS
jgi:hypothetical protein